MPDPSQSVGEPPKVSPADVERLRDEAQRLSPAEQLEKVRVLLSELDPVTRRQVEDVAEAFRDALRAGGAVAGMAFGLVGCEIAAAEKL
jgi:hypothetical protein